MPLPASGTAVVKSVISGDSLILRSNPKVGKPSEETMIISNVTAPRNNNQEFGFEAREFLRTLLVGKAVHFRVENTNQSNLHFGVLTLPIAFNGETDVARILVKHGWAQTRKDSRQTEDTEILQGLETQAKASQSGIWGVPNKIPTSTSLSVEPRVFLQEHKSKPIDAIVEQVRDGSSLRVLLLLPNNRQYLNVNISGIKCPAYRVGVPNMPDLVEPFGDAAQFFVESRLLQRSVKIILESVQGQESNATFFGTILHPAGNIAELLLSEGFAKILDWNLSVVSDPEAYKHKEALAQQKKLRIWKGHTKSKSDDKHFTAVVRKIVGPDTVILSSTSNPKSERRVRLASVRGPKRQKDDQGNDVGYYLNAVEFLRNRLVGSKVRVQIEYIKPAEGNYESQECVSIFKNDKNVVTAMVAKGLLTVLRHKREDNNRSSVYEELLDAEHKASEAELAMHSKGELPVHKVNDVSENVAKANAFLGDLQRKGKFKGVVEYVISGSRFKVFVPSLSCKLTFALSGLKTPRAGGTSQKSEPFGNEALEFATEKTFQRDVELMVENVDNVGAFTGNLLIQVGNEKKNFGTLLLTEGLATVHDYSVSQNFFQAEMRLAAENAKDARKNVWKNYEEKAAVVEEVVTESKPTIIELIVSDITETGTLHVQKVSNSEKLRAMMLEFEKFHISSAGGSFTPAVGQVCSAKFSEDNHWYRAKILKAEKQKFQVLYLDYGNTELLSLSSIRPLPSQFALAKLGAQAIEAKLAYIDVVLDDDEFSVAAFKELTRLVDGKSLLGYVVQKEKSGCLHLVLYDKADSGKERMISINESLAKSGFACISHAQQKRMQREQLQRVKSSKFATDSSNTEMDRIVAAAQEAKKARINIWQYGDYSREVDEEV